MDKKRKADSGERCAGHGADDVPGPESKRRQIDMYQGNANEANGEQMQKRATMPARLPATNQQQQTVGTGVPFDILQFITPRNCALRAMCCAGSYAIYGEHNAIFAGRHIPLGGDGPHQNGNAQANVAEPPPPAPKPEALPENVNHVKYPFNTMLLSECKSIIHSKPPQKPQDPNDGGFGHNLPFY